MPELFHMFSLKEKSRIYILKHTLFMTDFGITTTLFELKNEEQPVLYFFHIFFPISTRTGLVKKSLRLLQMVPKIHAALDIFPYTYVPVSVVEKHGFLLGLPQVALLQTGIIQSNDLDKNSIPQ